MKTCIKQLSTGLLLLCTISFTTQVNKTFSYYLDSVYLHQIDNIAYEVLEERLWHYYTNPINLNTTTSEILIQLAILTSTQIDQFFDHLAKNGPLYTLYELQSIPSFDLSTIHLLRPFVYVEEESFYNTTQTIWERIATSKNNYLLIRYSQPIWPDKFNMYVNGKQKITNYLGSSRQYMTQVICNNPRDINFGIVARKSKGEQFTWDPSTRRYGFNLFSCYLLLQNKKWL